MGNAGKLTAVIGGQYGSEGKGTIVAHIANKYEVHVRVGSHNAGHSFQHLGRIWKMQQIPVGWCNPNAIIVLGRGALISPETLDREMLEIASVDPTIHQRLLIDADAGVLDQHHHEMEGGVEGEIHNRIGSTGEGVGAARIARLQRVPYSTRELQLLGEEPQIVASGFRRFLDLVQQEPRYEHLERYIMVNTPRYLNTALQNGMRVLLEGSQGVGLSVVHGPWPYVTTTDCGAAQLCADVGLPPHWLTDVLCVLRTFPIRVAGNSGPLKNEITWEELSRRVGHAVLEKTTVTKKVRRIGDWDEELVARAVELNAPTAFALNFLDYLSPEDEGKTNWDDLSMVGRGIVFHLEKTYNIPVRYIGTGGPHWSIVDKDWPA